MALKTFNLDSETYKKYSKHCKGKGISMSRQIENFIRTEMEKIAPKKETTEQTAIENSIIIKEAEKDLSSQKKEHPLMKYC